MIQGVSLVHPKTLKQGCGPHIWTAYQNTYLAHESGKDAEREGLDDPGLPTVACGVRTLEHVVQTIRYGCFGDDRADAGAEAAVKRAGALPRQNLTSRVERARVPPYPVAGDPGSHHLEQQRIWLGKLCVKVLDGKGLGRYLE